MHHISACEVQTSRSFEKSARSPRPVSDRAVDEEMPHGDKDEHSAVAHPLRERAADDGSADRREVVLSASHSLSRTNLSPDDSERHLIHHVQLLVILPDVMPVHML
eukprot:754739-Hanusia_phi.AAC.1